MMKKNEEIYGNYGAALKRKYSNYWGSKITRECQRCK
jgi:hypothetical protein